MKKLILLTSLSILLAACGSGATVKPDAEGATGNNTNTFDGFVSNYAAPADSGDSTVYKFVPYSKMMKTYNVGVQQARFIKWCSSNTYPFSENGDMALKQELRKRYPTDTITDGVMCGDGKGGFYGFANFDNRNMTAFIKAGSLNLDFWPEDEKPELFWPNKKAK